MKKDNRYGCKHFHYLVCSMSIQPDTLPSSARHDLMLMIRHEPVPGWLKRPVRTISFDRRPFHFGGVFENNNELLVITFQSEQFFSEFDNVL